MPSLVTVESTVLTSKRDKVSNKLQDKNAPTGRFRISAYIFSVVATNRCGLVVKRSNINKGLLPLGSSLVQSTLIDKIIDYRFATKSKPA